MQRSPRGYQLVKEKRVLVVNSLIRLPSPIKFEPLPRKSGRLEPEANPLRRLFDKDYYQIESSMQAV